MTCSKNANKSDPIDNNLNNEIDNNDEENKMKTEPN